MRNETVLRLMSGLVLVGIFAAGALFGAGIMKWGASPDDERPPPRGGPIQAIKTQLALDADQIAALDAIEAAHRQELQAIGRKMQHEVRGVILAIEDELVPKLRPDQIEKLTQWRKTRRPPPMGHPGLPGGPPGGPPGGGPPGGGPPNGPPLPN